MQKLEITINIKTDDEEVDSPILKSRKEAIEFLESFKVCEQCDEELSRKSVGDESYDYCKNCD